MPAEIALVTSPAEIATVGTEQREVAVTAYLMDARDRLALAVQESGPESVAALRAEMATVQEMTKQLGLSRDIQDDAAEMVRRSEYSLGKAIRAGQQAGVIRTRGEGGGGGAPGVRGAPARSTSPGAGEVDRPASPYSFASNAVLHGDQRDGVGNGAYALAEADEEQFEEAITEAREEGNLSRANVARKIKGAGPTAAAEKWDRVAALAAEGHTRHQVAEIVGMSFEGLTKGARQRDIHFPADSLGKRRRLDSSRVMSGVTSSVAAAAFSIQQIDLLDLDEEEAQEWADSLSESITTLRRAVRQIRESFRE